MKSGALGITIQPCDSSYMPRGSRGERRPADVIGNAVRVMQIATGEVEDNPRDPAKQLAREGGLIGGPKRAAKLSKKRRTEIASLAAKTRWARKSKSKKPLG